jgi:predicted acyl esterase
MAQRNPSSEVSLCVGPWAHAQWSGGEGTTRHGDLTFESHTEEDYRESIELPFLRRHLMDDDADATSCARASADEAAGAPRQQQQQQQQQRLSTAVVFECGSNVWRRYDSWPPAEATPLTVSLQAGGRLVLSSKSASSSTALDTASLQSQPEPGSEPEQVCAEWLSDPASPVPYTAEPSGPGMRLEHMSADQRFAARRPDVAVFELTRPLEEEITVVGAVRVSLRVSTTGAETSKRDVFFAMPFYS